MAWSLRRRADGPTSAADDALAGISAQPGGGVALAERPIDDGPGTSSDRFEAPSAGGRGEWATLAPLLPGPSIQPMIQRAAMLGSMPTQQPVDLSLAPLGHAVVSDGPVGLIGVAPVAAIDVDPRAGTFAPPAATEKLSYRDQARPTTAQRAPLQQVAAWSAPMTTTLAAPPPAPATAPPPMVSAPAPAAPQRQLAAIDPPAPMSGGSTEPTAPADSPPLPGLAQRKADAVIAPTIAARPSAPAPLPPLVQRSPELADAPVALAVSPPRRPARPGLGAPLDRVPISTTVAPGDRPTPPSSPLVQRAPVAPTQEVTRLASPSDGPPTPHRDAGVPSAQGEVVSGATEASDAPVPADALGGAALAPLAQRSPEAPSTTPTLGDRATVGVIEPDVLASGVDGPDAPTPPDRVDAGTAQRAALTLPPPMGAGPGDGVGGPTDATTTAAGPGVQHTMSAQRSPRDTSIRGGAAVGPPDGAPPTALAPLLVAPLIGGRSIATAQRASDSPTPGPAVEAMPKPTGSPPPRLAAAAPKTNMAGEARPFDDVAFWNGVPDATVGALEVQRAAEAHVHGTETSLATLARADHDTTSDAAFGGAEAPPTEVLSYVQRSTGADLSGVKIHRDTGPVAQRMQARAFTHDGEIHVPAAQGDLGSGIGRSLVAHELTHVAQQRTLGDARPDESTPGGQALERQAQVVEHAALGGIPDARPTLQATAMAAPLQRMALPAAAPAGASVAPTIQRAGDGLAYAQQPQQSTGQAPMVQRSVGAVDQQSPMTQRPAPIAPNAPIAPTIDTSAGQLVSTAEPTAAAVPPALQMPSESTGAGGGGAGSAAHGGPAAGATGQDLEELADKLFPRIRARLRREMRSDRERLGALSDLGG